MNNCPVCNGKPEADWVEIPDSEWCSYFIGCESDLCETMLSFEVPKINQKDRQRIETILQTAWNAL